MDYFRPTLTASHNRLTNLVQKEGYDIFAGGGDRASLTRNVHGHVRDVLDSATIVSQEGIRQ